MLKITTHFIQVLSLFTLIFLLGCQEQDHPGNENSPVTGKGESLAETSPSNIDYQKLDEGLKEAIRTATKERPANGPGDRDLAVFIYLNSLTDPSVKKTALTLLNQIGARPSRYNSSVFAATLSVKNVILLSQSSWVKSLQLSQKIELKN